MTHVLVRCCEFGFQADSTPAGMKTAFCNKAGAFLAARNFFLSVLLSYLRVGHTHEDVDARLALIVYLLFSLAEWQTPLEICQFAF